MPEYLLYFNQQWVPDRPEEWFVDRGPRAMAAVAEMEAAGVHVFSGGLEELEEGAQVYAADPERTDPTTGEVLVTDGPYAESKEWLGGFAIVDVADDEAAKHWGARIAEACGWTHEVRRFKPRPPS